MQASRNLSNSEFSNKTSTNISGDPSLNRTATNGTLQGCPNPGVFLNSSSAANETFLNSTLLNEVFSNGTIMNGTYLNSIFPGCQFPSHAAVDAVFENDTLSDSIFSSLEHSQSTLTDGKYLRIC